LELLEKLEKANKNVFSMKHVRRTSTHPGHIAQFF